MCIRKTCFKKAGNSLLGRSPPVENHYSLTFSFSNGANFAKICVKVCAWKRKQLLISKLSVKYF